MRQIARFVFLLSGLFFSLPGFTHSDQSIRLATTTSTYHSGLLDYLLPEFEKDTGLQVKVLSAGSGKALKMGENGDVDVIITHAPDDETKFVEAGFGILPRPLMYNDFILVGPKNDPANIKQEKQITNALTKLVNANADFISRGDDSGTHKKEMALWKTANLVPTFSGYKIVGQGMGPTITMANELQAYTLSDRGTWAVYRDKVDLVQLVQGDSRLHNPYQVIVVNPQRHADTNSKGARLLSDWLISKKGQQLINQFRINGESLFIANALPSADSL